jgi:hypothetical protein
MKGIPNFGWLKVLILTIFVACLSAGLASAQDYSGKFTLPFEVQWGSATLPAGEYSFRIDTAAAPYVAKIYGKDSGVLILAKTFSNASAPERSELIIGRSEGKRTVHALCLRELGVVFSYGKSQPQQMTLAQVTFPVLLRRASVNGK